MFDTMQLTLGGYPSLIFRSSKCKMLDLSKGVL